MTYRLVRTLPDGITTREHTNLPTLRRVEAAVFFTLTDNRAATPPEATTIARAVAAAPIGTLHHGYGYTFRIVEEV